MAFVQAEEQVARVNLSAQNRMALLSSQQQSQGVALSVSPGAEDERCQEHDIKCFIWFIFEGTLKTEARVQENKGKDLTS